MTTYDYDRRGSAETTAMGQEIAIGALERGVRTFAKNLEKLGLKTDVSVHKSGRGGYQEIARSYVELEVTGTYKDAEGEDQEAWATVEWVAGGYGALNDKRQIGGTDGWRAMAAEGLKRLLHDLERQGWKKP